MGVSLGHKVITFKGAVKMKNTYTVRYKMGQVLCSKVVEAFTEHGAGLEVMRLERLFKNKVDKIVDVKKKAKGAL
jgi:hypothetical protein